MLRGVRQSEAADHTRRLLALSRGRTEGVVAPHSDTTPAGRPAQPPCPTAPAPNHREQVGGRRVGGKEAGEEGRRERARRVDWRNAPHGLAGARAPAGEATERDAERGLAVTSEGPVLSQPRLPTPLFKNK